MTQINIESFQYSGDMFRHIFDIGRDSIVVVVEVVGVVVVVVYSSSSSSSRKDRWVHFQQNAGLRLFAHT